MADSVKRLGPEIGHRKSLWCFGHPWSLQDARLVASSVQKKIDELPNGFAEKDQEDVKETSWAAKSHVAMRPWGLGQQLAVSSLAGLAGAWFSGVGKAVACRQVLHHYHNFYLLSFNRINSYKWSLAVYSIFKRTKTWEVITRLGKAPFLKNNRRYGVFPSNRATPSYHPF